TLVIPPAATVTEGARSAHDADTPCTERLYVTAAAVGFLTMTVYDAASPGRTVREAGSSARTCSTATARGASVNWPEVPRLVKSTVASSVTARDSPGSRPLTVDVQVIVREGVPEVNVRSNTSVSKSVPGMTCVGATLNESRATVTPVLLGTCTRAVTGM